MQQGHIRCQHCNSTGTLQVILLITQSSSTDGTHAPCVCPHNVVDSCCAKLTCRHLQRLQVKPLQQLQTASKFKSNTVAVNERRHQGPSTNHRQERQRQQALPTPWLQNTFNLKMVNSLIISGSGSAFTEAGAVALCLGRHWLWPPGPSCTSQSYFSRFLKNWLVHLVG